MDKDPGDRPKSRFAEHADKRKSKRMTMTSAAAGSHTIAFHALKGGFKTPKFQNSYRLYPNIPFDLGFANKILAMVMHQTLANYVYDTETAGKICMDITLQLRDRLYRSDFDRVKYAVNVILVENRDQGFVQKYVKFWDAERDSATHYVYEAPSFYMTGFIFAIYYE